MSESMHPSSNDVYDQEDEEKSEEEEVEIEGVTQQYRCDQCGSRSYYKVVLNEGELFLCYHHFNRHKEALDGVAVKIIDESKLLHRN